MGWDPQSPSNYVIQRNQMYVCIIPPFAAILISCEKVFEVKGSFEKDISLEMSSYSIVLTHTIFEKGQERMAHINQFSDAQP